MATIPTPFVLPYHPVDDLALTLHGYAYIPNPQTYPGLRPSVLCTRTGGYTQGGAGESNYMLTDLCASGYFCLFVDCRLAKKNGRGGLPGQTTTGYYPQQTDDLAMGMIYLRAHPLCNGKVALACGSGSGGHAGWLATTGVASWTQPECAVILSGELDAGDRADDATSDAHFMSATELYFQSDDAATLTSYSATGQATPATVPIYFSNGRYESMPWSVSQNFKGALDAAGLTNYTFHENTDYGGILHSFGTYPENAAAIKTFLAAHIT